MVQRWKQSGPLHLDEAREYSVQQELVSQLALHQLEAVRYLYSQLKEYTGIFLNDESGLGKCHQTVAYLSALPIVEEDRSLILCPSLERIHHWAYHLDTLAPALRSKVHPKFYHDVTQNQSTLRSTDWHYVVVDETREFMTERQLESLRSLAVKRFIFISSVDLLDRLDVLKRRLEFCYPWEATHLRAVLEEQQKRGTKAGLFKLYLCTRRFVLRRHAKHYRRVLPLIARDTFEERFGVWCVANDIETVVTETPQPKTAQERNESIGSSEENRLTVPLLPSAMTPEAATVGHSSQREEEAVPIHFTGSEPLFEPNETNTELMPVLRVESDSQSEENNTIPETASDSQGYLQFGQELSCNGFASSQRNQAESMPLATERYKFPFEKFLRSQTGTVRSSSSSLSVESIPNGQPLPPQQQPIVISSSDSPPRAKSPPLFEDSDHDTRSLGSDDTFPHDDDDDDDDLSLMELLVKSRQTAPLTLAGEEERPPSPSIAPRRHPSFSTPITALMFGPLAGETQPNDGTANLSSMDMFAESLAAGDNGENVFEITKNNAFHNRIAVQGEEEGVPTLKVLDDSSDEDDVQVVEGPLDDGIINLIEDTADTTPKRRDKLSLVAQTTPPSGNAGTNSAQSPGRGWLGKRLNTSASVSPASGKNTPSTSRSSPKAGGSGTAARSSSIRKGMAHIVRDAKRRKKLDELFQIVDDKRTTRSSQRKHVRGRGSR